MCCIRGKQQKKIVFRDCNKHRNMPHTASDEENNCQGCNKKLKAADLPEAQLLYIVLHIEELQHIPTLISNLTDCFLSVEPV